MASGPETPRTIRFFITLVSTDPPLLCDVRAERVVGGWVVHVEPENGLPPFDAFAPDSASPVLTWLGRVAASLN